MLNLYVLILVPAGITDKVRRNDISENFYVRFGRLFSSFFIDNLYPFFLSSKFQL
jgi:hypothetical protein